jgi:hypothetical protein
LEKETETQDEHTTVSVGTDPEIANTLSSQKSMIAQFSEKGTENESGVYDTKVSVESDLDAMIDEMINTETPVEAIRPSGRKSMVAQFLEKGTGNESEVQDITVSVPSEKEKLIPNPFMGKKFLGNDVPN